MAILFDTLSTIPVSNIAVATMRTLWPFVRLVSLSVSRVAFLIGAQPVVVQSCHWYVTSVGVVLQVGAVAVSVPPTAGAPWSDGGVTAAGRAAVQPPERVASPTRLKGGVPVELT